MNANSAIFVPKTQKQLQVQLHAVAFSDSVKVKSTVWLKDNAKASRRIQGDGFPTLKPSVTKHFNYCSFPSMDVYATQAPEDTDSCSM